MTQINIDFMHITYIWFICKPNFSYVTSPGMQIGLNQTKNDKFPLLVRPLMLSLRKALIKFFREKFTS